MCTLHVSKIQCYHNNDLFFKQSFVCNEFDYNCLYTIHSRMTMYIVQKQLDMFYDY
jgi:hypothetical protein